MAESAPLSHPPELRSPWQPAPLVVASVALHVAGAAALALAPHAWPAICGCLFADHAVLAANSLWPQSSWLGPTLTRLPADAAGRGEVALTFDDGPDAEVTPRVLDLLDRFNARASFFCIGRRVAAHPEIAREIVRRGHRIENHSWSHPHLFACYEPVAQRREVQKAQDVIAETTGRRPAYFRAPAGFRNPFLDRELSASGLHLAAWTWRGYDTLAKDPARIASRLLRALAPGDILLLHDGSALADRGNRVVLECLPQVLAGLSASGLHAVPLEESGAVP